MKKLYSLVIALALVFTFAVSNVTSVEARTTKVNGYYRSSGTYVQPYYRTSPNSTRFDNYSTRGNYNPYSGRYGTRSLW